MSFERVLELALLKGARSAIREELGLPSSPRTAIYAGVTIPSERYGAFVTLKRSDGGLRGCIGTMIGEELLDSTIARYARAAAFEDPRFPPVSRSEIDALVIEISVLTPMKRIPTWESIRIGTDGVLLRHGYRRAVFLPQVAPEQGWDLETTLTHLAMKAGLPNPERIWREPECEFLVFQAMVWSEGADHA